MKKCTSYWLRNLGRVETVVVGKELIMHTFLLRQMGGSTVSSSLLCLQLTCGTWRCFCKEREEGVYSDFLWVKSATFRWRDWKIMSVLLNNSSSVVKVGVLAPHMLEPALCKQFNKVIVAMIEVIGIWGFVLSLLQLLKQLNLGRTTVTVSVQHWTCL